MRGLYTISRALFEHPAFKSEPFTEREAWVWLIGEAQWKNNRKRINGQIVELERGQLSHSIRFLSIRWDWSISRVNRFLKRLKTETMIETENETGQNVITICNYETYQDFNKYRETVSETVSETRPKQERNKEEHQITPDNKIYIKDDYFFVGKVGKINRQQADAWKDAFPHIDLRAELEKADAYYSVNPQLAQNRWFFKFASWIARANSHASPKDQVHLKKFSEWTEEEKELVSKCLRLGQSPQSWKLTEEQISGLRKREQNRGSGGFSPAMKKTSKDSTDSEAMKKKLRNYTKAEDMMVQANG